MSINKNVVLSLLLISLLALTVSSQNSKSKSTISVEEAKSCSAVFYDEYVSIIQNCAYYKNYTSCLNNSGPNTNCIPKQDKLNFKCETAKSKIKRNSTQCSPLNKFTVSVNKANSVEKKEIDFSNWGACIQGIEDNCIAITCGSEHGGSAVNGAFNGCDGGKSCQKFIFCDGKTKVLYKASRSDFVEEDPTYHLTKLGYREVTK